MKKAKIMLTAIGLLSVVGGALAFKAHRVTGTFFCSTTVAPIAQCNIKATTIGQLTTTLYCTTNPLAVSCTKLITVRKSL